MDQGNYLKNLANTLFEFSKANILCDTTLVASNREFRAHSVILAAASPFLKSAFQNSSGAGNMYRIELLGLDGAMMESILFLIYTGSLKSSSVSVNAAEYDYESLISTCEQLGLSLIWSEGYLSQTGEHAQQDPINTYSDDMSEMEKKHSEVSGWPTSVTSTNTLTTCMVSAEAFENCARPELNKMDVKPSHDAYEVFDIGLVKDEIPLTASMLELLSQSDAIDNTISNCQELPFVCELCNEIFPEGDQLKAHQAKHMEKVEGVGNSMKCEDCGRQFKYATSLQKHRESHKDVPEMQSICHICGIFFNQSKELQTHLATVHSDAAEMLLCEICNQTFQDAEELDQHQCLQQEDERPFMCDQCPKSFRDKNQLKKHQLVHVSVKEHICEVCSRGFSQEYYLKKHLRTHSSTLDYACPTCGKRFKLLDYLKVHLKGQCGSSIKEEVEVASGAPHECQVCGRSFMQVNYLKKHMRLHTGEKPYECGICGKRFKDNCLRTHLLTHSGERPFGCDKCEKRFARQADLQSHIQTHSSNKLHRCTFCVRSFHKRGDLLRHFRIHTGERPYVCETCGKSFKILFHLRLHSYVHATDRPHKCEVCGKAFSSAVRLKKHEFIHSGVRPYSCPVCQREFNRLANMKSHLRIHEQKIPSGTDVLSDMQNGGGVGLDSEENLAGLSESENVGIIYCKMEQPEVLIALPMDALQKHTL